MKPAVYIAWDAETMDWRECIHGNKLTVRDMISMNHNGEKYFYGCSECSCTAEVVRPEGPEVSYD